MKWVGLLTSHPAAAVAGCRQVVNKSADTDTAVNQPIEPDQLPTSWEVNKAVETAAYRVQ